MIEIFTRTENDFEFVLEKLFRGSIINYRTFFMEDNGKVFYRFGRNSICFVLSIDTLNTILPRHEALAKKFRQFKVKTMSEIKPYPLDYIMNLPKHLMNKEMSLA